jgi:hypothetical protein
MKNLMLFLMCLSFTACAQTNKLTSDSVELKSKHDPYFIVSQGGGFTGKYETFMVLKSGLVNKLGENQDTVFYKELPWKTADSLFQMMEAIDFHEERSSAVGNMNYSLTIFKNGKNQRLSWADNKSPKKEVLDFYQFALKTIKAPTE